jgi:hypothetical protein
MKRVLSFFLVLTLCLLVSACSGEKTLPKLSTLETMTDSQIEDLLIGQTQSALQQSWGEPHSVSGSQHTYELNPDHQMDGSHKAIQVTYSNDGTVIAVRIYDCK